MVYKRMHVLSEEEYEEYKRLKEAGQPAKCPEDGREFPNAGMLGHHIKSHVAGFQCNICGKVLKTRRGLTTHLKQHPPQVQPSTHSIFDQALPMAPVTEKPKKKHKQRSVLNFDCKQWLTLK